MVPFSIAYYLYAIYYLTLPHTSFFFFNDTATTEIYTLSLHDALPISFAAVVRSRPVQALRAQHVIEDVAPTSEVAEGADRKSTRLNSSHSQISYAVFCLKKKKQLCNQYGLTTAPYIYYSTTWLCSPLS